MSGQFSRRISRRRRRVFVAGRPEQLETRQLLTELSGFVFHDTDGDGAHDSGETGVAGVLVTLDGINEDGDAVTRRVLTQGDGSYSFDEVDPGTYDIIETQPAFIADGEDATDVEGVTTTDDQHANVVVGTEDLSGLNFGEGILDATRISPLWLLASTAQEDVVRDMRADLEDEAGNTEIATAIRSGEDELDSDLEINARPSASNDSYTLASGVAELDVDDVANGVLANDSDPEGSALTAALVDQADNGTVSLSADGSFTYTPDSGFSGTDSFTYTANDGFRDSTPATVTITVEDRNTFNVSASALEFDVVGDVEASANVGSDVVFDFADSSVPENFRLNPDDNFSGNTEAPVVVVEYLDYACPACFRFHNNTDNDANRTLTTSPGDFLVVYRYLPLGQFNGNFNLEAARAAEAAGRQGLFVEMHNLLFDTDNWDDWRNQSTDVDDAISKFESYGQEIAGFDLAQFRVDFNDQAVADRIERDRVEAAAEGFNATPSFVVAGEAQPGGLTTNLLNAAILEAEDAPFKINHFATDNATAGQLIVFNQDAITEDDGPFNLQIEARGTDGNEIIDVTVNVTP